MIQSWLLAGRANAEALFQSLRKRLAPVRWAACTLTTLALSVATYNSTHAPTLNRTTLFPELTFGIAGAAVTAITLVLTLSQGPIQRAFESLTPSIATALKNDLTNAVILACLAAVGLVATAIGLEMILRDNTLTAALVCFVLIGILIDTLRWHFRHTVHLLSPAAGIRFLRTRALNHLRYIDKWVARQTRVDLLKAPDTDNPVRELVFRAHLWNASSAPITMIDALNDIRLVANRSLKAADSNTAIAATRSIANLVSAYVEHRREAFTVSPHPDAPFTSFESDLRMPILTGLESLKQVSETAYRANDETVVRACVESLLGVAQMTVGVQHPLLPSRSSPLSGSPLQYLGDVIGGAIPAGADNIWLQGCRALGDLGEMAVGHVDLNTYQILILQRLRDLVLQAISSGRWVLANYAIDEMMRIAIATVRNGTSSSSFLLSQLAEYIGSIVPAALVIEARLGYGTGDIPLSRLYSGTSRHSMHLLMATALSTVSSAKSEKLLIGEANLNATCEFIQKLARLSGGAPGFSDSILAATFVNAVNYVIQEVERAPV